jgi:pyruvate/2-oxoglutarate dehydrogenase complex dihydrolipoamide acyltransferase (E2) component
MAMTGRKTTGVAGLAAAGFVRWVRPRSRRWAATHEKAAGPSPDAGAAAASTADPPDGQPRPPTPRPRRVERHPFPSNRRLVVAAFRAGRHKTPMYGFLDVDVTLAKRLLAATDPPSSMTAFIAASVARVAAAHPEVHAYRDWRGRLVTHQFVDVSTMVEVPTGQGLFAIPHTLRDADVRSVVDLSGELRRVKATPFTSPSARWAERYAPLVTRLPGAIRGVYAVMSRSVASRRQIGTVAVTSIGMFGGGAGYGLTPLTLMSLELIVGGISQQPRVIDRHIEVRDVLNLTLAIDHDVIDGAPAARFSAELRQTLETAAVLSQPAADQP